MGEPEVNWMSGKATGPPFSDARRLDRRESTPVTTYRTLKHLPRRKSGPAADADTQNSLSLQADARRGDADEPEIARSPRRAPDARSAVLRGANAITCGWRAHMRMG